MNETPEHYERIAPLAEAVCSALRVLVDRLGFPPGTVVIGDPAAARYWLLRDPVSDEDSVAGEWRNDRGQKQGSLVFHADGTFFVEYDVIRDHPTDRRWFVVAVDAFGRGLDIRVEARLLPALS